MAVRSPARSPTPSLGDGWSSPAPSAADVDARHGTGFYVCLLDDGTGEIGLLFLGPPSVAGMVVGTRCTVEGTARIAGGRLVVWNPLYRIERSRRLRETQPRERPSR